MEGNFEKYKKFFSELVKFLILIVLLLVYIYISYNNNWTSIQRVSSTETRKVNPIGSTIGLKMYTNGVLVVGMSDVSGIDGGLILLIRIPKLKKVI